MKHSRQVKKSYVELDEKPLHNQEEVDAWLGILQDLHMLRSHLCELERKSCHIRGAESLSSPLATAWDLCIPTLREFNDSPSLERLRQATRELLGHYFQVNEVVWKAETPFEPPTEENEKWRTVGTEMHAWYELLKGLVLFDVGMYNKECIDPVFNEIFIEGLQRAYAGEPIAIEYMRSHWGMCSGAPEPPPPSQG